MDIILLVLLFLIMLSIFTLVFLSLNIVLTKKINIDYSKSESTHEATYESTSESTYEATSEATSEEETNLETQYLTESESTNLESSENESCNKSKEIRQEIRNNNNLNENGERIDGEVLMDYSDKDDVYGLCVQPFVHEACTEYARCTDSHNLKSGCYVESEDGLVVGCPAKCCNSEILSEESNLEEESQIEEESSLEGFLNYNKWFSNN